ncbi:MAG: hypothetical protein IV100_32915 [Myxococcales bacterium]|nr:hypothetical protein [Myxococcales bacterium]
MKRTATMIFAALISLGVGCNVDTCAGEQCEQPNSSDDTNLDAHGTGTGAGENEEKVTAIGGVIRDSSTLAALQGVLISTEPPTGSVLTNASGEFVIDITSNPPLENLEGTTIRVNAEKVGYTSNFADLLVVKGQLAKADILMTQAATEFNIEVTPKDVEFVDGDFFGEDIAHKSITVKLVSSPNVQSATVSVEVPVEEAAWLSATPTQATLSGSPMTIVVTIDRTTIEDGTRTAEIRFTAAGATELTTLAVSYTRSDAGSGDGTDEADATDGSDVTDAADGSDATDGTEGADGDDAGVPDAELLVKIYGTAGDDAGHSSIVSPSSTIQLRGLVLGNPDSVIWENATTGQTGQAIGTPFWSADLVTVVEGPNYLTVTATRGDVSRTDSVLIIHNPSVAFEQRPTISPDQAFVGEPETLMVTAPMRFPTTDTPGPVGIWRVSDKGVKQGATPITDLLDNGNLSNCDEVQGDGVFSGCVLGFECTDEEYAYFALTTDVTIGTGANEKTFEAMSPLLRVECGKRIDVFECAEGQSLLKKAKEMWKTEVEKTGVAAPKPGSTEAAAIRDVVLDWVKAQPEVASAGSAMGDGSGLWVEFKGGFLGAVTLGDGGFRSGAGVAAAHAVASMSGTDSASPVEDILSKTALVLAPFHAEFSSNGGDEADVIAARLGESTCPTNAVDGAILSNEADLRHFRSQHQYGIVSITTHGEAFFGDMAAEVVTKWDWDHQGGQEVLWTGEDVVCDSFEDSDGPCSVDSDCDNGGDCIVTSTSGGRCVDRTQMDLRKGRLILTDLKWALAAPFVSRHTQLKFPKSLVYLGGCRTLYNGTLAAEYLAGGARAVFGYSGYVTSGFAYETGKAIFDLMVEQQLHTDQTFTQIPHVDPNTGARARLFGTGSLSISDASLINGNFEQSDLTGWNRSGDSRVIDRLGLENPVVGHYMALISTGLGFSNLMGEINQSFCIPAGKTSITYYWKFYSEEFKEFCGSKFQDGLEASLQGEQGALELENLHVDDLCHYEDGSCGACANPESGTCKCGSDYVGLTASDVQFDQGGAFMTPWQMKQHDITSFAGAGPVQLRFFIKDTVDSIYDTVILIDGVKFD